MDTHLPALTHRLPHLRSDAQALETCVWLPAPIRALIIACLTRLFDQLEQLFRLWETGSFPAAAKPAITRRTRPSSARHSRHRTRTSIRRKTRARIVPVFARPHVTATPACRTMPHGAITRPLPTHDPPATPPPLGNIANPRPICSDIVIISHPPVFL